MHITAHFIIVNFNIAVTTIVPVTVATSQNTSFLLPSAAKSPSPYLHFTITETVSPFQFLLHITYFSVNTLRHTIQLCDTDRWGAGMVI